MTTINDVVRGSIIALDDEGVARAVEAVKSAFKVSKHKDRFSKPTMGYKDHMFQIVPNGSKAEIQVHRIDLLFAKEV